MIHLIARAKLLMSANNSSRFSMSHPRAQRFDRQKRVFDIIAASILLVLLSPAIALIALLIGLTMGTPVFFRQERPGLHGRLFRIWKFRTMRPCAKDEDLYSSDALRLTKLGKFLRRASLDELPQLWNVLKGEMSLVGPRPLLAEYLPKYSPREARRHDVRPGITGWAQVQGRQVLALSERFELDLFYVENRSMILDLRILWRTVFVTAGSDGVISGQDFSKVDDRGFMK